MQNVITKRARAREARLPSDGRLLGSRSRSTGGRVASTSGSVPHRLVEISDRGRLSVELIGTSPSGWIDATLHNPVPTESPPETSRWAQIGNLANGALSD